MVCFVLCVFVWCKVFACVHVFFCVVACIWCIRFVMCATCLLCMWFVCWFGCDGVSFFE